jgi:hypothetical protein
MELVSQENVPVGVPEPCIFSPSNITSFTTNTISQDTIVSSTSQGSASAKEHSNEFCELFHEETRISIIKLSPQIAKQ